MSRKRPDKPKAIPGGEAPKVGAPMSEAPKNEVPNGGALKADAPRDETPKAEAPKTDLSAKAAPEKDNTPTAPSAEPKDKPAEKPTEAAKPADEKSQGTIDSAEAAPEQKQKDANSSSTSEKAAKAKGKKAKSSPESADKPKKERNLKIIDISETSDQVFEIIDDALDENPDDLGFSEESSVPLSNISISSILTVIFGIVVMGFAVFGMISAAKDIQSYVHAKKANLERIEFFESLILPLCASDAPTFGSISSLNSDVAITAACWDIILFPSSTYTAENGSYTISYLDVDIRINKLFGKGVNYTHTTVGDQEISFEYDEETGMYTIPAYPRILAYYPTVDSLEPIENGYKLTVSYHSPVTNWIESKNPVDKVMIYTVTGSGIAYNISAIEVGEIFNAQEY